MAEQAKAYLAQTAKKAFENQMELEGIKYRSDDERLLVRVTYSGSYFEAVPFSFLFDGDGGAVALSVYSIASFTSDQIADAMAFCNKVNGKYRWLRFFVDADGELTAAADAYLTPYTAGAACTDLLRRAVSAVDAVCKELCD